MLERERKIIPEKISDEDMQEIVRLRQEIKEKNGFNTGPLYKELFEIFDRITKRKFLNKQNVNHVVNATRIGKTTFDIFDRFDPGLLDIDYYSNSFFYYSIHGNPYVGLEDGNKLIIFSPKHKLLQRLLRSYLHHLSELSHLNRDGQTQVDRIKHFLEGKDQQLTGVTTYDWGNILLPVFRSYKPRWSQIADCIVDLDKQQVYFFQAN